MPNARESARSASAARTELLNALKQDHRQARQAFQDFDRLERDGDAEACHALVLRSCAAVALHTALEEELFYPAIRTALRDPALIDEAEVEHAVAKTLIADLQQSTPEERAYAATFKVLGEYVQHHVKEEESEIFPQLVRARIDWDDLRQRMTQRREALAADLLMPMRPAPSSA